MTTYVAVAIPRVTSRSSRAAGLGLAADRRATGAEGDDLRGRLLRARDPDTDEALSDDALDEAADIEVDLSLRPRGSMPCVFEPAW